MCCGCCQRLHCRTPYVESTLLYRRWIDVSFLPGHLIMLWAASERTITNSARWHLDNHRRVSVTGHYQVKLHPFSHHYSPVIPGGPFYFIFGLKIRHVYQRKMREMRSHLMPDNGVLISRQRREIHTMSGWHWPTGCDVGSALIQHWVNVSCLLRCDQPRKGWAVKIIDFGGFGGHLANMRL